MKLKDLKQWVNMLPEHELEKDLMYNSIDYGISGSFTEIIKAEEDLYFVGDDPALLHSSKELEKLGYNEIEISDLDVEIPANCYYVELSNEYSILERFMQ